MQRGPARHSVAEPERLWRVVTAHLSGATGRSKADAPEIYGEVHLRDAGGLKQGDIVEVLVEDSDEHDLYGVPAYRFIIRRAGRALGSDCS